MSRRGMIILGIVIVLVAVFAGAFIHPLLFLIGLAVLFVAFFADW
jgi:4-hydroxybenzoate polyprenyltransferase